jgi:nitrate reductase assembly molybdenum cofactor insertion protein NarJ
LLSDDEMEKLKSEFSDWEERIEAMSEYVAKSGKTYKNYLAALRSWAKRDAEKTPAKKRDAPSAQDAWLKKYIRRDA